MRLWLSPEGIEFNVGVMEYWNDGGIDRTHFLTASMNLLTEKP